MSDLLDESLLDHHHHHQQQQQHRQPINILLPPEEYAEDLELRLGRANGNIYYRKTGVEGIHDGQVMVRLKKKRFVILDYSIIPTEEEIQLASIHPHIACPEGAGKRQCVTPGCQKVGVPVLLYDSDPTEPASLYLRSGLCFTCQRNLNEKRRTQRKRKSDLLEQNGGGTGEEGSANGNGSHHHHGILPLDANAQHLPHPHHHHQHAGALPHRGSNTTSGVFTIASDQKKLKLNGSVVHLAPDAIIINGPVSGARHHGEGYSFHEIGIDLSHVVQEAVHDTHRLIHAVSPTGVASTAGTTVVVTSASSSSGGVATPMAMSSDASAILSNLGDDLLTNGSEHHRPHHHQPQLLHQHHHHTASTSSADSQNLSSEDIAAMHDKAFLALSKSLFLLSQWKAAWDAEVAAAVAQETVHDACLADAVASAAAVVAAAVTGDLPPLDAASAASGDLLMTGNGVSGGGGGELQHTTNSSSSTTTNMVSLLLAAEQKGDDGGMMMMKVDDDELDAVMERATNHHGNSGDDVQTFEV